MRTLAAHPSSWAPIYDHSRPRPTMALAHGPYLLETLTKLQAP
jgi:hypothetical protein